MRQSHKLNSVSLRVFISFLQSTVGVSISKEMKTRNGTRFIPEAHVAWLHEYLNEGQVNTSTFTGAGGSFTTKGFDPASDSLNVGASVVKEPHCAIKILNSCPMSP